MSKAGTPFDPDKIDEHHWKLLQSKSEDNWELEVPFDGDK